jgi:hypothetical protein
MNPNGSRPLNSNLMQTGAVGNPAPGAEPRPNQMSFGVDSSSYPQQPLAVPRTNQTPAPYLDFPNNR